MVGFVVRRLRGRVPLAATAMLSLLITTSLLTALAAFSQSVGDAGLRHALQGPDFPRTAVVVRGFGGVGARGEQETAVARLGRQLFVGLPDSVRSVARSRSYALPGGSAGVNPDLTTLASIDRTQAQLLAGQWPVASTDKSTPVEAAVPQAELDRMGLSPAALPATVELTDRYDGTARAVRITGVYQPVDRDGPYWRLDELGGRSIRVQSFTTYGPLLVDDSAFTAGGVTQDGRNYLITADFSTLRTGEVAARRTRAGDLKLDNLQVETELTVLLGELESDQLVSRSTLLIGALQLAVLAVAALLLVVQLLTSRQAAENELLAARGGSRLRIGAFTAIEAALLALPAALLAPPLTPLLVRLLAGWGPVAHTQVRIGLPWQLWPLSAGCALLCVLLAAVPGLLRSACGRAAPCRAAAGAGRRGGPLRCGPGAAHPGGRGLPAACPVRRRRAEWGPVRAARHRPGAGGGPHPGAARRNRADAAAAAVGRPVGGPACPAPAGS